MLRAAFFLLTAAFSNLAPLGAATLQVTSLAQSGPGTLRARLAGAQSGDVIVFDPGLFSGAIPATLPVASPLFVPAGVEVRGPGAERLTLDGGGVTRVFEVMAGEGPGATIRELTIAHGAATYGGGVLVRSGGSLAMIRCIVRECRTAFGWTDYGWGGGIKNHGTLLLDECWLSGNTAYYGGGIASTGTLVVARTLVSGNEARRKGGGIFAVAGSFVVESSTISGNEADYGAGIAAVGDFEYLGGIEGQVLASTIAANCSEDGVAGLWVDEECARVTVHGSIIANNYRKTSRGSPVGKDAGRSGGGILVSRGYNLVRAPVGTWPTAAGDRLGVDPRIGDLADNGGFTPTHAIGLDSPALDGGDPAFAGILASTDQRGLARVSPGEGGTADIGAYEFQLDPPVVQCPEPVTVEWTGPLTPATVAAAVGDPNGGTLTVTFCVNHEVELVRHVDVPVGGATVPVEFPAGFPFGENLVSIKVFDGRLDASCEAVVTVVDRTPPVVTLLGSDPTLVECACEFGDPGATAVDARDGALAVHVSGEVDPAALGSYVLTYAATDSSGNTASVMRTFWVVDTKAPSVTVPEEPLAYDAEDPEDCTVLVESLQAGAMDACDAAPVLVYEIADGEEGWMPITLPHAFGLGETEVFVSAVDVSGNRSGRAIVHVVVQDRAAPLITLNGEPTIRLPLGAAYVDPGAVASDACQEEVEVEAIGAVDTCAPGAYRVEYRAVDGAENVASAERMVIVEAGVSLSAPELVERLTDPGRCGAEVDLGQIVEVGGIPDSCADAILLEVTVTPPEGEPVGDGLGAHVFPVGVSRVVARAVVGRGPALGTVLAETDFEVAVSDPFLNCADNTSWPQALSVNLGPVPLALVQAGEANLIAIEPVEQFIHAAGTSRWYRFDAQPGSRITLTLSQLAANFDLTVYKDIGSKFIELLGLLESGDPDQAQLALLGAEFAPDAFSPDAFSPDAFSPDAFSPDAFSPDAFSPDAFSPDAFSPDAFSPDAFSPDAFSPDAFSPDAFSPDAFSDGSSLPDAFSAAQLWSAFAYSARSGTLTETIAFNTYLETGVFYVRVRGRNGAFSTESPFLLTVEAQQDICSTVDNFDTRPASEAVVTGAPTSLFVGDFGRMEGTAAEKAAMRTVLDAFAVRVNGVVVDVGLDPQIALLNAQADANPACPLAKNLVAQAIAELIRAYRRAAPSLRDITIIGNDKVIPFYRTADEAGLAPEQGYAPPVKTNTHSESSLRTNLVLTQDFYGSSCRVFLITGSFDIPELPVGRLVETPTEVRNFLQAHLPLFEGSRAGIIPTESAVVTGYDFLGDAAAAIDLELRTALGGTAQVDTLISPSGVSPFAGWNANAFRSVVLSRRHDLAYIAAHQSQASLLAADYTTRVTASELLDPALDLQSTLWVLAGCHSGYNTVNDDRTAVTESPDWAQAFAQKRANVVAGTGYQYGETEFLEYGERLYREYFRQLRTGGGPVSIGQALVRAKRRYLADTSEMRGIHEKTLVQATLFGLPMLEVDPPGPRLAPVVPSSDVPEPTPLGGPGVAFGLSEGLLAVVPQLERREVALDVVGSEGTVVAQYFVGRDGAVALPAEPVRALEQRNVGRPEGLVRGVGFREGRYTDVPDFLPLTGAPTTEVRGVHGRFDSGGRFWPVRFWNLNHVGAICGEGGTSELNLFATQFAGTSDADRGTLRRFDRASFSVFYNPTVTVESLSNPPAINRIESRVEGGEVVFEIEAAAALAAGVQEVWITYTGVPGSTLHGWWRSLRLGAPANSSGNGMWTGRLALNGGNAGDVRFMVQAVSGAGLVAANMNNGFLFTAGVSPYEIPGEEAMPTRLQFVGTVPATGAYRDPLDLKAKLTTSDGTPIAGKSIRFRAGTVAASGITDDNGEASARLVLVIPPGNQQIEASFAGAPGYRNSRERRNLVVTKAETRLAFLPLASGATLGDLRVQLSTARGTPLPERPVLFFVGGDATAAEAQIANGVGIAQLAAEGIGAGQFSVRVVFGSLVSLPDGSVVNLVDPFYGPAESEQIVVVRSALEVENEKAVLHYSDRRVPGATNHNRGLSHFCLRGDLLPGDRSFAPGALAAPGAQSVGARLSATSAGRSVADFDLTLLMLGDFWVGGASGAAGSALLSVNWAGCTEFVSVRSNPSGPRMRSLYIGFAETDLYFEPVPGTYTTTISRPGADIVVEVKSGRVSRVTGLADDDFDILDDGAGAELRMGFALRQGAKIVTKGSLKDTVNVKAGSNLFPTEGARFRAFVRLAPGTGPLYGDAPAELDYTLELGTRPGETAVSAHSLLGGAGKPWTVERQNLRLRLPDRWR